MCHRRPPVGETVRDPTTESGLERTSIPWHDYPDPPLAWAGRRERLPACTYHAFERSGHWSQAEERAPFDAKVIAWLSGHAQAEAPMKPERPGRLRATVGHKAGG
ncbi:MAG TPA: hypothetical protein VIL85_10315 [Thermomicrobiales bacterium]